MDTTRTTGINLKEDPLYQTHPHAQGEGLIKESGKLSILALPVDEGGCGWYRVRQFIEEFERQGLANTCLLEGKEEESIVAQAIEMADVIVSRPNAGPFVRAIKEQDPNKPFIVDHDDNTFITLPSNQSYKHFGTSEVFVEVEGKDPIPLWVNGRNGFNQYKNLWNLKEIEFLLESATLTTSPVEKLSEKWDEYNGNAAVVPNAIDFNLYPDVNISDPNKNDEIRIGWQGGVSHAGDFEKISKPLRTVLSKNKNVHFYTVGSSPIDYFIKEFEDRIHKYSWLPFKAHPYRMASLDLDIAIIPLEDKEFNDYKSEIKFSEFSAIKVPSLVSDRLPYSTVCKDGVNSLSYKTPEEFQKKLERLIDDSKLRSKIAHRAHKWVRDKRDLSKVAPKVIELYESIV